MYRVPSGQRPRATASRLPGTGAWATALLTLGLAALPAWADGPTQKPGLWETTVQLSGEPGSALEARLKQQQAMMANLSPEQRAMMEQKMGSRGVNLSSGGQSVRVCVTPEEAAHVQPPAPREGCKQTSTRTGDTWNVSMECPAAGGRPATSGRGTMTMSSPTAYDGQYTMDTVMAGKTERMMISMKGRWLADDCGAEKPRK